VNPEEFRSKGFDPKDLESTVIAFPLLRRMQQDPNAIQLVLIALHNGYGDPDSAAKKVRAIVDDVFAEEKHDGEAVITRDLSQYVVARLTANSIRAVVARDRAQPPPAIYQMWPDFDVHPLINKSASTVKADAARTAFATAGSGIVWAVVDSGIHGQHCHFAEHKTLELDRPLRHHDFTYGGSSPLTDRYGHGTHVAGIIAGDSEGFSKLKRPRSPVAIRAVRDENDDTNYVRLDDDRFVGMAPKCKLVSYKVLDDDGRGETTAIIAALQHIQKVNRFSDKLKIHGVNLSVGYPIDPTWFACGQRVPSALR
jgi:subtilisin family serine protease